LLILLGAVMCVLVVACTNVANLFLSRTEFRRRDVGVRAALGASSRRIITHGIAEPLVVALAGGIAGIALASAGVRLLPLLAPADLPRIDAVTFDWRVLAFAIALSIVTALLVGFVPALRASRVVPRSELAGGTRGLVFSGRQGYARHSSSHRSG
jgi:ABC-type antimicrobial peptide transport system permease subunit